MSAGGAEAINMMEGWPEMIDGHSDGSVKSACPEQPGSNTDGHNLGFLQMPSQQLSHVKSALCTQNTCTTLAGIV